MNEDKTDYVSVVYDEQRSPKTEYPAQLAKYLSERFELSPGERLLEIGCGRGDFLAAFERIGLKVSGLDRDLSTDETARILDIKHCDLTKDTFPFADESFDVVYHKSVIEHVYDPLPLMQESLRVLKPGGKLIILTPDWQTQFKIFYEDFTHCRPYDTLTMSDLLRICSIRNSGSELFYQLPVQWRFPCLKYVCPFLRIFIGVPLARRITEITGIKFFRWACELMVLGYGIK